jgi:NADH-quinone oxidoreductase subunit J
MLHLALFIIFGAICVGGAINLLRQKHPIDSALSLVVVMGSLAGLYLLLGAEFLAAIQVIVYAGAIMVLFVFVIMLLNQGPLTVNQERAWLRPRMWLGPSILALALLGVVGFILLSSDQPFIESMPVGPKDVSISLYGPYVIALELASMLLLPGLIGAYHLGRRLKERP